MTSYPAQFVNDSGVVELEGSLVTAAPIVGIEFGVYSGANISINDGLQAALTWDTLDGGVDLLDRSTLDDPTVLTAGVYAVSATVQAAGAITPGGFFRATLALNPADMVAVAQAESPVATAALPSPVIALASCIYIPARGDITVVVDNFDGVGAVNYKLASAGTILQKLS